MASSYRGYPYTQNVVTNVPSLSSDQVAQLLRWNNLPVKKVTTKPDPAPVVYVDLPADDGGQATPSQQPSSLRDEEDEPPVIYIDLPENTSSGVSQPTPEEEPAFVQDTILYDQFKDERIAVPQTPGPQAGGSRPRPRPNNLDLSAAGSSSGFTLPSYLTKETQVYNSDTDEFRLSPLPVSDYPYPPPSYEEVERGEAQPPPVQVITAPGCTNNGYTPPRTEDRKFLYCHHCRSQVHSLVIMGNGPLTHIFAWIFLFMCLFPLTAIIYMTSVGKYKYHYCPNCNKKVAYEVPAVCGTGMTYVND